MLKVKVNKKFNFEISSERNQTLINGLPFEGDILKINERSFHVIYNDKSYNAELIDFDKSQKTCSVKVGNNIYPMQMSDQFDELLQQLGMDNLSSNKIAELKAPMPGLVLRLLVSEGDQVMKGDNLLVLEAMKMENIIKAPADVVVKSLKVIAGDKVEKNQLLIQFS
jgi:biotin carboxyl carrier protein